MVSVILVTVKIRQKCFSNINNCVKWDARKAKLASYNMATPREA